MRGRRCGGLKSGERAFDEDLYAFYVLLYFKKEEEKKKDIKTAISPKSRHTAWYILV